MIILWLRPKPARATLIVLFFSFEYHNLRWRVAATKFSFSRFFFLNTWILFVNRSKIVRPALPVLGPKTPKIFKVFTWKKIVEIYWYFFTFLKRNHLFTFRKFLLLNFHCFTYSAMENLSPISLDDDVNSVFVSIV